VSREEDELKVLVIGATGAVGVPLVSQLVERGHEVVGTSRTRERAEALRRLGAEPALLDVLDRDAVRRTVLETRADAIVHQATSLAGDLTSGTSPRRSRRPTGSGRRVPTTCSLRRRRPASSGSWLRATAACRTRESVGR
jgi:uncharacterized protein YbjT (DUF2867 family)